MRTCARPLLFNPGYSQGQVPIDSELFIATQQFCEKALAKPIDFTLYRNIWVVCEEDAQGKLLRVTGIICGVFQYDLPVVRFVNAKAAHLLTSHVNDYLLNGGFAKGSEVTVYVNEDEAPEQKCPAQKEWLERWGAQKSHRKVVKVK